MCFPEVSQSHRDCTARYTSSACHKFFAPRSWRYSQPDPWISSICITWPSLWACWTCQVRGSTPACQIGNFGDGSQGTWFQQGLLLRVMEVWEALPQTMEQTDNGVSPSAQKQTPSIQFAPWVTVFLTGQDRDLSCSWSSVALSRAWGCWEGNADFLGVEGKLGFLSLWDGLLPPQGNI